MINESQGLFSANTSQYGVNLTGRPWCNYLLEAEPPGLIIDGILVNQVRILPVFYL
jgi:hypothetical protein